MKLIESSYPPQYAINGDPGEEPLDSFTKTQRSLKKLETLVDSLFPLQTEKSLPKSKIGSLLVARKTISSLGMYLTLSTSLVLITKKLSLHPFLSFGINALALYGGKEVRLLSRTDILSGSLGLIMGFSDLTNHFDEKDLNSRLITLYLGTSLLTISYIASFNYKK
jgi:hypothetical protein